MKKLIINLILALCALVLGTNKSTAQYDTIINPGSKIIIPDLADGSSYTIGVQNGGNIDMKASNYIPGTVQWLQGTCGSFTADSITSCGSGTYGLDYNTFGSGQFKNIFVYLRYFVKLIPDTIWVNKGDSATVSVGTNFALVWWYVYGQTNYFNTNNSVRLPEGKYRVKCADDGSYKSYDTIVIAALAVPCITVTSSNPQAICQGQSYVINGNSYSNAGTYKDSLHTAKGCDSIVTTILTVNPLPTVNLGADTTIQSGQSATLNAGTGGTYLWSTNATSQTIVVNSAGSYWVKKTNSCGDVSDTIKVTVFVPCTTVNASNPKTICQGQSVTVGQSTYTSAGTYKDTLKTTANCDSIVTTTITVNPLPTVNLGADTTINQGQSVTLNAGSGGTYLWSTNATSQTIVVNTAGNYWVRKTNSCGDVSDTIKVTVVVPCTTVTANNPQTICQNGSYIINGHTYNSAGSYKDTLKTKANCDSIVTTTITVNPLPTVNLGADTTIQSGQSVTLNAGNGGTYLWSTNATSQTIVVNTAGNYWIRKTNGCGNATDTIHVDVLTSIKEEGLSISVNIYPNPAGDYIKIDGLKPDIYTINVFDATGRVVLQTSGNSVLNHIDVSMLQGGIYYLSISSEKGFLPIRQKIIKL